ncbi:ZYBA0S07-05952g1_1 [Zygosaccharomyces bailii CLIB 213]|uniref:ZYBA0S07-05952g1_1 n=1 Tax=Zygosaccharomyces bailii (strain CLIB 213 / ATCC 58445 / CBS 680 / BCRC 21525 / NBRC 1098 / NCYC 1416 / NRRL Y-2227) TaxID=1333698 RepID=A0A8J2T9B5_ZYGB2|nr:ZYBA0S07-05952g1_1 [Zygosaccharomyces bailii CLIB 213]
MGSPSKNLVEGLEGFHISSPGGSKEKLNVKQYLPNNDFADSKFLSFVEASQSRSYVKKLGDWSMSYGTVQQRPGESPQHANVDARSSFEDGFAMNNNNNDENAETPQWKQYMMMQAQTKAKGASKQPLKLQLDQQPSHGSKDPASELVLTASLSDISGIPTNTFKRHGRRKIENEISKETQEDDDDDDGGYEQEEENQEEREENLGHGHEEGEEDDIDPALEARGVFDNILRKQRSNYELPQPPTHKQPTSAQLPDSAASSETTSSFFGETPSSLSPAEPHNPAAMAQAQPFAKQTKKPIEGMKLITPEEMGLVFDNVNGVWYKPAPKNQDVSSSRTLDSSTNNSEFTTESTSVISKQQYQHHHNHHYPDHHRTEQPQEEDEEYDDTPMDAPEINPRFLLKSTQSHDARHGSSITPDSSRATGSGLNSVRGPRGSANAASAPRAASSANMPAPGDVTTVSQVHTSFRQSKRELVAVLTDAIPPRGRDWATEVLQLDLRRHSLGQVVGLDQMLPSLRECDLSHNKLRSLHGVPPLVTHLRCSHNKLGNCTLDGLPHLETLHFDHNALTRISSTISGCLHLREVNLSYNKIRLLDRELGASRMLRLDLSHNELEGTIDLAKLSSSEGDAWQHLEELDLSHNRITKLRNVNSLRRLRVLKLDGNPLQEILEHSATSGGNLRTLSVLDTTQKLQRIVSAPSGAFPYHKLRILRCDSHRGAAHWRALPRSLEELHLQGGDLHKLPHWDVLPGSLRRLTLRAVKGLTALPRSLAWRVPTLQELCLAGNELASLYGLVEALPVLCLVRLDLRGNPVAKGGLADIDRILRMACARLADVQL